VTISSILEFLTEMAEQRSCGRTCGWKCDAFRKRRDGAGL